MINFSNSEGFGNFFDEFPGLIQQATENLAKSCSKDGALDPQSLDQQQVASYELALAYAEYRAARVAWESYNGSATQVQQALCQIYIASAVQSIKARLEPLAGVRVVNF